MEAVLLREAVFLRRETLLLLADALRTGLRRAVLLRREVFLRRAGDFLLRVVFLRREVFLRRAGDFLRRVVDFLRRVVFLRRAGDLRRRVVDLRRVVLLRLAGDFLLRVDFLRRVVFLLRAGARRLAVDLRRADVFLRLVVVFLLAIVFPPLERALALRLPVFLRLAALLFEARRLAGLRGFKITTSDNGIVLSQPEPPLAYKGVVGLYVPVIQNGHNGEVTPTSMGGTV
jgi:hypothetical protein